MRKGGEQKEGRREGERERERETISMIFYLDCSYPQDAFTLYLQQIRLISYIMFVVSTEAMVRVAVMSIH